MMFRQLTRMTVGYVAASSVAAGVIIVVRLLVSASQGQVGLDAEFIGTTMSLAALVACFAAVLALAPFLIAEAFAKCYSITSSWWYVGAGAVTGLVAVGLNLLLTASQGGIRLTDLSDHPVFATVSSVSIIAAVAGICAGYTYWLIAVRRD